MDKIIFITSYTHAQWISNSNMWITREEYKKNFIHKTLIEKTNKITTIYLALLLIIKTTQITGRMLGYFNLWTTVHN